MKRRRFALDPLGRVVIPVALRDLLGWQEGTRLRFAVDGRALRVTAAAEEGCVFCGQRPTAVVFRDRPICGDCLAAVRSGRVP